MVIYDLWRRTFINCQTYIIHTIARMSGFCLSLPFSNLCRFFLVYELLSLAVKFQGTSYTHHSSFITSIFTCRLVTQNTTYWTRGCKPKITNNTTDYKRKHSLLCAVMSTGIHQGADGKKYPPMYIIHEALEFNRPPRT